MSETRRNENAGFNNLNIGQVLAILSTDENKKIAIEY